MKLVITGGYGFIGSALIRYLIDSTDYSIVNLDKLTYAANLKNLGGYEDNDRYKFIEADICDPQSVEKVFYEQNPSGVIHLAAESHVDRSIDSPGKFIKTNIVGTYNLLEASLKYYVEKSIDGFLFHHVSTDEVYGDLSLSEPGFTESSIYNPSSPYSASKASSDHLVKAWNRTYGLPIIISNCSNNYGPYQSPEKLIPLMISNAIKGLPLPIYGDGSQVRDWIYVEDHAKALLEIFHSEDVGETYNVGGNQEKTNLVVVEAICSQLDKLISKKPSGIDSFSELIKFVDDRPGHDLRYAIDSSKLKSKTRWEPQESFSSGIEKTVKWYINNMDLYKEEAPELTKRRGSKILKAHS